MNDPLGISTVNQSLTEVAEEYKTMSKVLLVFCGLVGIGIIIVSIAIFRQSSK